jgi:hypothetical protein
MSNDHEKRRRSAHIGGNTGWAAHSLIEPFMAACEKVMLQYRDMTYEEVRHGILYDLRNATAPPDPEDGADSHKPMKGREWMAERTR